MLSYKNMQNIVNSQSFFFFTNLQKETITSTMKPSMYPSKVLYPTLYNLNLVFIVPFFVVPLFNTFNTYVYIYEH